MPHDDEDDIHDDDALADALAAQYAGLITSAIPIVAQPPSVASGATAQDDLPAAPAFVSPFDPPVTADHSGTPWSLLPAPDPSDAVESADAPPELLDPPSSEGTHSPDSRSNIDVVAVPPLVSPIDRDPFNWSISATGKVTYLDELPGEGQLDAPEPPPHDQESETFAAAGTQLHGERPVILLSDDLAPGSISAVEQVTGAALGDVVGEPDRAFADILAGTGAIVLTGATSVSPSGPIPTTRRAEEESALYERGPTNPPLLIPEAGGLQPTAVDVRAGRAVRMFWLWFSANSSVISVSLGAVVFAAGMSLRQSVVGILAGVALSFVPLALTTLAGKRSGQPTMVVSRATFGLRGNVAPAILAVISRLFWGAVMLWLLSTSVAAVTATVGVTTDSRLTSLITLGVTLVFAVLVALFGNPLLARAQLIITLVSAVMIAGLISLTARYVDIPRALTVRDGSWMLAVGAAVLVFSVFGLVWAQSGADLARYQRPDSGGASTMLSASFGAAIPTITLLSYGALLSASNPEIAAGLATDPVQTLGGLLPSWYPVPLIAAIALSLFGGVVIAIYSGAFALHSVGVEFPRQWSVAVTGIVVAGLAVLIVMTETAGIAGVFRDFATTLAVPTAAWLGIFGSEIMIRNRRFDSDSLLTRGGVYPDVRWVNLLGFALISVIGFGLTTATVSWLSWQGYAFTALGIPLDSDIASTDLGVVIALVLGVMLPLLTAVRAIRQQELRRVSRA